MPLAPHPFTLRQLQYVVAVAELASFRKAAGACRVAQPSLSAQVAQVEEALGVRLFERDRRSVRPTAAGLAFVARARDVLGGADQLVEAAVSLADPFRGALRVGVIPTISPYLLPEAAPALRARFPRLAFAWVEDRTAALVEQLARAELDAAVLALEADIGDLPRVVLGVDPFVFAAAPGHRLAAARRAIRPDEIEGERVLLLDDGHCFRDQALALCTRAGADEADWRATSLATLVQIAAGGAGVTLLPRLAVALENRHRALRVRPFVAPAPARTLALVWRRRSGREAALKAVGEALRATYARLVERGERPPRA